MTCCCPHSRSAGRIFSRFAQRYRRRFEKKGFEPSQRQLIEGLERAGLANAAILEIGSGVGYLHQHLLQRGAATAVGVDLAPKMIEQAEALAHENGLATNALPGRRFRRARGNLRCRRCCHSR